MIWAGAVFFPLLLAALLFFAPLRRLVFRPGLWLAPLPALLLAVGGHELDPAVFPSLLLGTSLHFGPFGRVFLLITALLWTASGLYAGSYLRNDPGQNRFSLFFLLTLCGNLGLTVAQDLASFYTFFALMSFAAYGLILHDGTEAAMRAGRVYLTMTVAGEVLLASAFFYAGLAGHGVAFEAITPILTQHSHGPLILALAFSGFGVKAGVILLHLWLPLAHPVAPTPASAVLSGAMIKAGILGWLHFFAPGEAPSLWGMGLAWVGLLGALHGVVSGVGRRDPKTILAYSSVSQMGLMTMAFGFALASGPADTPRVLSGLLLFVLVHALAKGALFLGIGLSRVAGRGSLYGRVVLLGLGVACLVLAGLPLTGGALVKQVMKEGASLLPEAWSGFFSGILSVTAVGTTVLLSVFLRRVSEGMPDTGKRSEPGMILAWAALLGPLLLVVPLSRGMFPGVPDVRFLDLHSVFSGIWPIATGVLLAGGFVKSGFGAGPWKGLDGLILESLEHGLRRLAQRWQASPYCDPSCGRIDLVAWTDRLLRSRPVRIIPDRLEERLMHWHSVGVLLVFLLLGFVFLVWWG